MHEHSNHSSHYRLARCVRTSIRNSDVLIEIEWKPGHRESLKVSADSPVPHPPRPGDWLEVEVLDGNTVRLIRILHRPKRWSENHPWANPILLQRIHQRFQIIRKIRQFFYQHHYLEVDTPLLVPSPGQEPWLEPFRTEINIGGKKIPAFLPFSPEYGMKKLLAMGFQRIFQIAHAFRNDELSTWHEPEFLLLEFYHAPGNMNTIMEEIERLVLFLNNDRTSLTWQNRTIDLTPPWPRQTYDDLFEAHLRFRPEAITDTDTLKECLIRSLELPLPDTCDRDTLLNWAFLNGIEPHLLRNRPLFITHYPASMAALARLTADGKHAERFELYLGGIELANGFSELNDPEQQRHRFEIERQERIRAGKSPHPVDEQFLFALEWGMPPAGGVAVGIDRLTAILTHADKLADVLPFPVMNRFPVSVEP